jgi:hypothetical protein
LSEALGARFVATFAVTVKERGPLQAANEAAVPDRNSIAVVPRAAWFHPNRR